MRTAAVLLVVVALAGCSTLEPIAESTDTFLACKAVDVATTAYALHHGFTELNPIVKALIGHSYIPLVLLAYGTYWLLEKLNEPKATMAANALTCGVAARNVFLLVK